MAMFGGSKKVFTQADIPTPEIIEPESVPSLRWGIFGAGDIAEVFAETVKRNTKQQLVAVASRTPGKGEAFAAKHGIASAHASYEQLAARDDIDAIYVATLPHRHLSDSLIAINQGKHVLVEKPSAISAAEARQLYSTARERGVFAMEAMWTRYLPQSSIIRQLVADQALGEIRLLQADFGQDNRSVARLWLPEASIMQDMGIYPISFAQMILGSPSKIFANGVLHSSTNEAMANVFLEYESGARAVITVSAQSYIPTGASVSGDLGLLVMKTPFFVPSGFSLHEASFAGTGPNWTDDSDIQGHAGLCYQVNHFAKYVGDGLSESPLHSHAETVEAIEIGEEIRRQIGVKLPA